MKHSGRRVVVALGALVLLQLGFIIPASAQSLIEGVWATKSKSEITIAPCPKGFCGTISKIVVPDHIVAEYGDDVAAMDANYTDELNKDPALRKRPIQGLEILSLKATSNPWYYEGEVYNPEDGNIYAGSVEVVDADKIKLKGCVLFVLCQEQEWTRVIPPR